MRFFDRSFWKAFLRDERGQSTTEYILILSVVVMVAIKFKKTFQGKLEGIVDKLGGDITKAMDE
jgi:pilus assembly protein Flp/PilA